MLIHNEDDIQFVTEFPCFLGHPVYGRSTVYKVRFSKKQSIIKQ